MSSQEATLLRTPRLMLTSLSPAHAWRVATFFARNRAHLDPWNPLRPQAFYTEAYWRERMAHSEAERRLGLACRMFLLEAGHPNGEILGTANLSQIARGAFQSCMLGYGLGAAHVGKGLMHEALTALIAHAFDTLGLHRIQANYIPTNERSASTLRKLGFVVEGYARDYLQIAGQWRDHVLTARYNSDWRP